MATEVKAYEANGRLYRNLSEAREAELTTQLSKVFKYKENSVAYASTIALKWKEVYTILEKHAVEERLLGGKI